MPQGDPATHHAMMWRGGVGQDLGAFDGPSGVSSAYGINAHDHVVGSSTGSSSGGAFLWISGTMSPLPGLLGVPTSSSSALAINDSDVIVGYESEPRAVVWYEGRAHDLISLVQGATGWALAQANDVSNAGYVVGIGISPSDHGQHGFLLTPL
jgi:uncharacterized membrane protein